MKKLLFIWAALMLSLTLSAQTQQGFVKTKGRMMNGEVIHGEGLKGAIVSVKGRNPVLVKADNGAFSFPIPAQSFKVEGVQKDNYQLVNAEAFNQPLQYSTNPIYLVMEIPSHTLEDQLKNATLFNASQQATINNLLTEVKQLKMQNLINEEEYNQRLAEIAEMQSESQKLVNEMAERYSKIDFDQVDEFNQQVYWLILNGELIKADSLIKSKGSMAERSAELDRIHKANEEEKAKLEQSRKYEAKTLDDFGKDCHSLFDICMLKHEHDSAAYWMELRASKDTSNMIWQYEVADFLQDQNQLKRSEFYYLRTLKIVRQKAIDEPELYEPILAVVLSQFATLYYTNIYRYPKCETMLLEAIEIQKRLVKVEPQAHEGVLAESLNRLAVLYKLEDRLMESEETFIEALEIIRRLAKEDPKTYEPILADALDNLASLYHDADKPRESEEMHIEALEIYRGLAKDNPEAYEPDMAKVLVNLGVLYKNTKRFEESEALYAEALDILVRLYKENPQAHAYDLATTYFNLALLYTSEKRLWECEKTLLQALELYRQLSENNPQAYKTELALTLFKLGLLMSDETQWFGEGIQVSRYEEAIPYYEEALPFYREFASNSSSYIDYYLAILYKLSNLYTITMDHAKQYELNEEWLPLLNELYMEEPDEWAMDYLMTMDIQASNCIFVGQFEQAEQYAREILSIIPSWQGSYTSLGASLLFQGKFDEAAQIFQQHKEENKDAFLLELDRFEAAGIIPEKRKADVERIRQLLTE